MMFASKFAVLATLLVAAIASASPIDNPPSRRLVGGFKYPSPSDDLFYKLPFFGLANFKNGEIIRERDVTADSGGAVDSNQYQRVTQVLYRTTDALGNPDATVATLYKPKNIKKGVPQIVSVALFEDSAALDCANSHALIQNSGNQGGVIVAAQAPLITAALQKGYYVTVPDYLGRSAAFIAGFTEGRAMLDGTRAILKHSKTIADTTGAQIIINGYSGGGHGAAWAVQLQPEYAPELPIIGGAYGGIPVNLTATLLNLNKGLFAGFGMAGLAGASNAYPELDNFLANKLYPNGTEAFKFLRSEQGCVLGELAKFPYVDYFTYIKGGDAVLNDPIALKYFQINLLGGRGAVDNIGSRFPLHIFHAKSDQVIPRAPVDKYVAEQCAAGASIEYSLSDISDHVTETLINIPTTVGWINQLFEGKLQQTGCTQIKHGLLSEEATTAAVGTAAAKQMSALKGLKAFDWVNKVQV